MISWEGIDLIIGCLLGDGRLECRSKNGTARLRIHHADSQKDYVFWKYNLLRDICLQKPKAVSFFDKRYNKKLTSWFFHTKTNKRLGLLHKLFYRGNKKIIPINIDRFITATSLAVWIMDDGCFDKSGMILNTQSFSLDEQQILKIVLLKKFGIKSQVNKDRNNFRLRIPKESLVILIKMIQSCIIPSMRYKLPPVTTDPRFNRGEIRGEILNLNPESYARCK